MPPGSIITKMGDKLDEIGLVRAGGVDGGSSGRDGLLGARRSVRDAAEEGC